MSTLDDARAAWPTVVVSEPELDAYVAERAPANGDRSKLNTIDLYLACACARGDEAALAVFHRDLLAGLAQPLARFRQDPAFVDEVRQQLCTKLLVAHDGKPRIIEYSGRGSLRGWVRSVAVRLALDMIDRERRGAASDDGGELEELTGAPDPELDYIKARYRGDFRHAFAAALAALPLEQRNAIRLHYLDGLTLAQIGKLAGVHESTASRWLASARSSLLDGIRKALTRRLGLDREELDSMMRLAGSRLEVSLHSLLQTVSG